MGELTSMSFSALVNEKYIFITYNYNLKQDDCQRHNQKSFDLILKKQMENKIISCRNGLFSIAMLLILMVLKYNIIADVPHNEQRPQINNLILP